MSYESRIGTMSSYTKVYKGFRWLSDQEAQLTRAHGQDPEVGGYIILDNVQNQHVQRDPRIGRVPVMNVGIAGIYVEIPEFNAQDFDADDKRTRLTQNKRKSITVDTLLGFIDQEHHEYISMLQWLQVLTRYIPELVHLKPEVDILYRTTGAKLPIPVHQSKVHPLATSGKKETITTELKDALLDFLEQSGQTDLKNLHRRFMIGGDGLTYAQLLQLKAYMQFHDDEFQSFENMEPTLQIWHTKWTDLIRIFQTHWGVTVGKNLNPASLGHSANKIGRPTPANMKKIDYYPGAHLAYTVLDARMLDCWA